MQKRVLFFHCASLFDFFPRIAKVYCFVCILINLSPLKAQTLEYNQFWSELTFNTTINDKWASEVNLSSSFSSTDQNNNLFGSNTQQAARLWIHYFYSPRWKFSAAAASLFNKDVPEIGQYASPEWRGSLQATYYFHKIKYTLSTRSRGEIRFLRDEEKQFETVYRFRQQIKYIKPLNSAILRKGVVYMVASDEVFVKSNGQSTGYSFFDRNQFNIGAGYMISDNIQIELCYANEYLPRAGGDKLYNAMSFKLAFNNLIANLRKKGRVPASD